jgi:aurora kinase, other
MIDKKTADTQKIDEFKRELKLHSQCKHKNVIELLDTFEDKDNIWMVMERAQSDLLTYLDQSPPKSEGEILRLSLQIIDGVEYLHTRDIYHRDIKLDNILVLKDKW